MTFPPRIERLLAEHRLEAAPFDDREIIGLWMRALTSYRDANVAGLSDEGVFTRGYDAGRQAATTLLAAVGLRVRGQAHHYTMFYTLAALDESPISQFGVELESVRQSRHMAVYDATGLAGDQCGIPDQLGSMGACLGELHPVLLNRAKVPVHWRKKTSGSQPGGGQ